MIHATLTPRLRFAQRLPKSDKREERCQDQFAYNGSRFAMADGATEAAYSQIWAELLVTDFCSSEPATMFANPEAWFQRCLAGWREYETALRTTDLPWFTVEKLRVGSAATFIGLVFEPDLNGAWKICACGDTCAFVVGNDTLVEAFPIATSMVFDDHPCLIVTKEAPRPGDIAYASGVARKGERFYIATDALAQWFLSQTEQSATPWRELDAAVDGGAFSTFIENARQEGKLNDDDVALMLVDIMEEM